MTINMQKGTVEWIENQWVPYSQEAGDEFIGRCVAQVSGGSVLPAANGCAALTISTGETDLATIAGPLAFEVDECVLATMHVRLNVTDVSVASVFIGFTDDIETAEMPIEDEDGTLGSPATDCIGILLEGEQDTTWQTVGSQNGTDNAQAAIGSVSGDVTLPDATDSNWHSWIIELTAADSGTMKVYGEDVNGNLVLAATRTACFRSSVALAPIVAADGRASAYVVNVAEMGWKGNRGSFFD